MERSLKTWRVGSYRVQVVLNAYRVRGLGPLWRRFNEYREKSNPKLKINPRGLRRTLLKDFFVRKRYCPVLQLYRGHKPKNISDVDWEHYLDRLEYDPDAVLKMFREDGVEPLNEWLKPPRDKWNSSPGRQARMTAW